MMHAGSQKYRYTPTDSVVAVLASESLLVIPLSLVELYTGQQSYVSRVCGLSRKLPIVKVDENTWIASNAELVFGCDIEFTETVGRELALRLKDRDVECLLVPEVKGIPIAYAIARNLGHKIFSVARKSVKSYMEEPIISEEVKSITTKGTQKLILDRINIDRIRNKRVAVVDDVVSTGGTIKASRNLVAKANAELICAAVVWMEGPDYTAKDIIYLEKLPIFVAKEKYDLLKASKSS